jgi:hypothetical protein
VRIASSHGVSRRGVTCILYLTADEDALGRFVFCRLGLDLCALNRRSCAVPSIDRDQSNSSTMRAHHDRRASEFRSELPKIGFKCRRPRTEAACRREVA